MTSSAGTLDKVTMKITTQVLLYHNGGSEINTFNEKFYELPGLAISNTCSMCHSKFLELLEYS